MQKQLGEHPNEPLFIATVMCLLFSFRFISLPLLIAAMLLSRCAGRRSRWTVVLRVAFFVSLLSPVDVPVGSYSGGGAHRSGPRRVPLVVLDQCLRPANRSTGGVPPVAPERSRSMA